MKEIKLTQGKVALVDDEDYDYLNQWKWHAVRIRNTYYASRNSPYINGRRKPIRMQWKIISVSKGLVADHIDGNGLNNQKSNLRVCTNQQNSFNHKRGINKSGYKGVGYVDGLVRARICINGKLIHLGMYKNEIEAAKAYDSAAIYYYGEFAKLNFPMDKS